MQDDPEGERSGERACEADRRIERHRRSAQRGIRPADQTRCEGPRVRCGQSSVDEKQRKQNPRRHAAGNDPECAAEKRRGGHDADDQSSPAEALGELVSREARRQQQQRKRRGDHRRIGSKGIVRPLGVGEGQEAHDPRPEPEELEVVRRIGDRAGRGRSVLQHELPSRKRVLEQLRAHRRSAVRAANEDGDRHERKRRPDRSQAESPAPAELLADRPDEEKRGAGPECVAARIERDRPRLERNADPLAQQPETRHVGAGEARAHQELCDGGGPGAADRQSIEERARHASTRGAQVDPSRAIAVGGRKKDGYGERIAAVKRADDPTGLRRRERPRGTELGKLADEAGVSEHADHLCGAKAGDQRALVHSRLRSPVEVQPARWRPPR